MLEETNLARDIMEEFADATGLSSDRPARRYLWTDAFAVCNFLDLYRRTENGKYRELALRLVDQVHHVLGRHRADDTRRGWISGLSEKEGEKHPTAGGLRIGKTLNERGESEPLEDRLEWERDGQYYHYLTKWMHALDRVSRATGDALIHRWSLELAKAAHAGFTDDASRRMFWKMSIDLSRPLVPSMGHHDPLDGLITVLQLQATAKRFATHPQPDLSGEISELEAICAGRSWSTEDPLGLGGLLSSACQLTQMMANGDMAGARLLAELLDAALPGLEYDAHSNPLRQPAKYRLAFRELGLAIGLEGVAIMRAHVTANPGLFQQQSGLAARIESLQPYVSLGEKIRTFWLAPENRTDATWSEHRDINAVMLATALIPEGFLGP